MVRSDITGPQVRPAPRVAKVWRDRAQWAVRGVSPPTVAIGLPGGDDQVSQRRARGVIDLALRIGEAMLSTGASASDVTATLLRITAAYGIRSTHVDITYTAVSVSIHRGLDHDPLTVNRVVSVRSPDYSRLQQVQHVVDRICGLGQRDPEPWDVEDASRALAAALNAPHPYRRWVVTAGYALLSASVVALFGAGPAMWVVAALTAATVAQVQRVLRRAGIAAFFNQAVSAAIPTAVATTLYWLISIDRGIPGITRPSLVIIAGIIVLLAGLTVMGAARDALDGYYVTAGARGLEVLVMTSGIAVGISLTLAVAAELGLELEMSPFVRIGDDPVGSTIAAILIGLAFAMTTYTGPRAALVAGGAAGVGWVVFLLARLVSPTHATAVAIAAAVVGALAHVAHRTLRVPELAIATAGIVAMLPGLAVYRLLYWLMTDSAGLVNSAVVEFFNLVSIALALAAGISIGGYVARRVMGLDRAALRASRRASGRFR